MKWATKLQYDAVEPLLASGDAALRYFVRRDLLGEEVPAVTTLWTLPAPVVLVRK